jgi:CBS domain-containing protein
MAGRSLIQIKEARCRVIQADFDQRRDGMRAADVMVSKVITVGPDSSVQHVASTLLANRISAVPVIDEQGKLIGIISEGDLMRRPEAGTVGRHSWWLQLIMSNRAKAMEYVKTHSRKAADLMTRRVITATPDTPLDEIATLLERNRIKRVPIMRDGKVVGIVSRANLLHGLASSGKRTAPVAKVTDSEIRKKVLARLSVEAWRPSMLNVTVHNGVVDLWGIITCEEERSAARVAVETLPGIQLVNDHLTIPPPVSGMV